MTESHAATILLVRSIESQAEGTFSASTLAEALKAAAKANDGPAWILRRATYLLTQVPSYFRIILKSVDPIGRSTYVIFLLTFAVGILSNHLSPTGKIHVLFNPVIGLVGWNLFIYFLLAARATRSLALHKRRPAGVGHRREPSTSLRAAQPGRGSPTGETQQSRLFSLPWPLGWLGGQRLEGLCAWWFGWSERLKKGREGLADARTVGTEFLRLWGQAAPDLTRLRVERVFHIGSLGLTVGAIAGMYIRGLFLEYNVVWRSTFITDPDSIAFLLRSVLGPAASALRVNLYRIIDARTLMSASGAPAAIWIHVYAVTAVGLIVLPRSILYMWESRRIGVLVGRISLDWTDEYFASLLKEWTLWRKNEVMGEIHAAFLREGAVFADGIADYVCENLFDRVVVRELEGFRQNGGTLASFEARIRNATDDFGPRLQQYVQVAEKRFEGALAEAVTDSVRRQISTGGTIGVSRQTHPVQAMEGLVNSVGQPLAQAIAVAVSTALAVALGTISGGFGEALGVAILVVLLHTTGPIAFVIGAIGGLLAAVAGWRFGREKITEAMKHWHVPGAVTRAVLWKGRMQRVVDEGRKRAHESIKRQVTVRLEPLSEKVALAIWARIATPPSPRGPGGGPPPPRGFRPGGR